MEAMATHQGYRSITAAEVGQRTENPKPARTVQNMPNHIKSSPEHWSNLKHLFLVGHDSHLLVELGGLCQAALASHVVELEDRGASL